MSIENEAWDAVEKERLNYIDKAKLIAWIENNRRKWNRASYFGGEIISEIKSGTFDKEDETLG